MYTTPRVGYFFHCESYNRKNNFPTVFFYLNVSIFDFKKINKKKSIGKFVRFYKEHDKTKIKFQVILLGSVEVITESEKKKIFLLYFVGFWEGSVGGSGSPEN